MTVVVAGVLERDGMILVCQRRPDQPHAGKWEFPGGKVETGETPGEALVRELREELGIEAEAGSEIERYEFGYPGKSPILLIFFAVPKWTGEMENRIFQAVEWERRERLAQRDFLAGDERFLAALVQGFGSI
jgi:8-oxo-dGTP diphosphatase